VISDVPLIGWVSGVVICALSFLGFFWQRRGGNIPRSFGNRIKGFLDFGWFYAILRIFFDYAARFIFFVSNILEGEGGILWVLLWIVLFLAILLISLGT
jgi:hypothetical protein